jgi:hypothetical protein
VASTDAGGVVVRPGLFGRLGGSARVTVASAGSGTVLLRSWLTGAGVAGCAGWVPVGWDERDPQRFWLCVVGALRRTTRCSLGPLRRHQTWTGGRSKSGCSWPDSPTMTVTAGRCASAWRRCCGCVVTRMPKPPSRLRASGPVSPQYGARGSPPCERWSPSFSVPGTAVSAAQPGPAAGAGPPRRCGRCCCHAGTELLTRPQAAACCSCGRWIPSPTTTNLLSCARLARYPPHPGQGPVTERAVQHQDHVSGVSVIGRQLDDAPRPQVSGHLSARPRVSGPHRQQNRLLRPANLAGHRGQGQASRCHECPS